MQKLEGYDVRGDVEITLLQARAEETNEGTTVYIF